jgi:site-specific recombinase XerD
MKSLSRDQMDSLLKAARQHSERDWLMILVAYNHGLRASEVCSLTSANICDGFITVNIRGKEEAAKTSPWLTEERRNFLIRRFAYWDQWAKNCDGSFASSSKSFE